MQLDIQVTGNASARLQQVQAGIPQAVEVALDAAGRVVLNSKRGTVSRTYRRAIPRTKKGTPRWKRTGDFQRGQTMESSPGERRILTVGNAAKYERRLANLPTSKVDGINRTNKAAEDAFAKTAPQVEVVFQQEFKNALGL